MGHYGKYKENLVTLMVAVLKHGVVSLEVPSPRLVT